MEHDDAANSRPQAGGQQQGDASPPIDAELSALHFRVAFECAPLGMMVLHGHTVVACNRALCDLFDLAESRLLGMRFDALFPDGDAFETIQAAMRNARIHGGHYRETRLMRQIDNGADDHDSLLRQANLQYVGLDTQNGLTMCSVEALSVPLLDHSKLTNREREVASLLRERYTAKEIGRSLGISHRTVEIYRTRLMKKYGVRNAASLVRILLREPDEPDASEPAAGPPGSANAPRPATVPIGIRLRPVVGIGTMPAARPLLGLPTPGAAAQVFQRQRHQETGMA